MVFEAKKMYLYKIYFKQASKKKILRPILIVSEYNIGIHENKLLSKIYRWYKKDLISSVKLYKKIVSVDESVNVDNI